MSEFINLNYYFRVDTQDYQLVLKQGFFENHKTNGEYGKGIYIVDDKKINLTNKNIILNVDLATVDNILFVENYESLLYNYIINSYSNNPIDSDFKMRKKIEDEYLKNGKTSLIGNKYLKKYAVSHNLNGIKIKNEGIMVLYDISNIRFIRLYDENLKTLRNFEAPNPNYSILWGDDTDSNLNENIIDSDGDDIVWGNF